MAYGVNNVENIKKVIPYFMALWHILYVKYWYFNDEIIFS